MRIYRFVPEIRRYAHPRRSLVGRWWPDGIELGTWMDHAHAVPRWGRPHAGGYDSTPPELPLSDFPLLSLQVPMMSERAAEALGHRPGHPDRGVGRLDFDRLRPTRIGTQRFFAVQPLLAVVGEPDAFIPEASTGIEMPGGETIHYHTRMFEPDRLRGEFFTISAHEPYAETYVTGELVERARSAGLTGIDNLELVFDDGPIPPRYPPPPPGALDDPTPRQTLEWELFRDRGYVWSYLEPELEERFRRAVLEGLLPI